jgi:protoheme IX farnesyltransferase
MTRLQRLAIVTTVMTYLLVLSGGTVRVTGSGLGCPDWPLCHGQVIPPLQKHTLIEYSHRLTASLVSVLVLVTAVTAWRAYRRNRAVLIPSLLAVVFLMGQVVLGGITVLNELPPTIVTAHLATSMALFACLIIATVGAFATDPRHRLTYAGTSEGFAMLAAGTALAIYLLMLTGSYVTGKGAGFACRGWPLCNGEVFPGGDRLADIHAFHRLTAAAAGVLVGVLLWQAITRQRHNRRLVAACAAVGAMFLAQVFVGAGQIWLKLNEQIRVAHLGTGALVWGALVLTAALAFHASRSTGADGERTGGEDGRVTPSTTRETVAAYIGLTKPRIIELLLVTTVPAMVLAERGFPNPLLILGTLVGGTLTAGGANAINCYIDRDIDQVMKRTRHRSLPSHRVTPERALLFGIAIGVIGFMWLAMLVNLLSAVLAVSAILFYVFVYTMWLKRSTVQNIVIGGAAGAVPPLVGWAAVTGRLDLSALVLFAIIFFWTPPHFWALALRYRADYAAAHVPMLPVERGEEETRRQIFVYSLLLVGVTLLLYFTGGAGVVYLAVALLLGAGLIRMALQLLRAKDAFPVMRLFSYSITYLAVLFGAMVVDQAVRSLA